MKILWYFKISIQLFKCIASRILLGANKKYKLCGNVIKNFDSLKRVGLILLDDLPTTSILASKWWEQSNAFSLPSSTIHSTSYIFLQIEKNENYEFIIYSKRGSKWMVEQRSSVNQILRRITDHKYNSSVNTHIAGKQNLLSYLKV